MIIGIIEGISCKGFGLIIGIGGAKACSIIIHPGDCAAELILRTYVGDIVEVGYSSVDMVQEASISGVTGSKRRGSRNPVEIVDNQYGFTFGNHSPRA